MAARPRGVVVTGGGSGIGLAVASRFARAGDRVMIVGRGGRRLAAARDELAGEGLDVLVEQGSVDDPDAVGSALDRAERELGAVDVLVANAGVGHDAAFVDTTAADWDELSSINLRGAFLTGRGAARRMIAAGTGGVILMTSSINAVAPDENWVAYSATKGAIDTMVRGMAIELAPHGIRVCGVAPGYIETPMAELFAGDQAGLEAWRSEVAGRVAMGRTGTPAEVAGAYVFLASDDASYITGTTLTVDGGRLAGWPVSP